jgi:hypothetical protein
MPEESTNPDGLIFYNKEEGIIKKTWSYFLKFDKVIFHI